MRATLIKFSIFVVVCTLFTGYLFFTIGNVRSARIGPIGFGSRDYSLSATFDDVTGLLPNDNVKIAGVVVGKVTGVSIEKGRARVSFKVRRSVKVPSDTSAAVRWRNLLGQRYVYLYPGSASTVLEPGAHITRTKSVIDLGELFNRLGPIIKAVDPAKVNTFLDTVSGALQGNEDQVRKALDDLAVLVSRLAERDEAIARMVTNLNTVAGTITARDAEIRSVLDNLVAISGTFSSNTAVLDEAVTELRDFSDNFGTLLSNNRSEIDRLITNLNAVVQVVKQKLPQLDETVAGLDEAAAALFRASRHGEWLNQTIPCGALFYPEAVNVPTCSPAADNPSGSGASHATGGAAIAQVIGSTLS